ncbi:unnamed protein product [Closterium sp. NIES-65]|nr:unnamed protein product [Closterium sp. NIES-65]
MASRRPVMASRRPAPATHHQVLACMVLVRQLCVAISAKPSVIPFSHKVSPLVSHACPLQGSHLTLFLPFHPLPSLSMTNHVLPAPSIKHFSVRPPASPLQDPPVLLADRTALCCALLHALVGEDAHAGVPVGDNGEDEGEGCGGRPVGDNGESNEEMCARRGRESKDGSGGSAVTHGAGSSRGKLELYFNTRCTGIDINAHTVTLQPAPGGNAARLQPAHSVERRAVVTGTVAVAGASAAGVASSECGGPAGAGVDAQRLQQHPPAQLTYDLLVGADGVRSVVRSALVSSAGGFAMEALPLFGEWVVASIPAPTSLPPNSMILVPRVPRTPGISVVGLPAQGGKLCLLWAWSALARPAEWLALRSNDEDREDHAVGRTDARKEGESVGSKQGVTGAMENAAGEGSVAGGSVAGGSVAGGSVAGGSVAGGSVAGGSVAGGSVAEGSVAEGSVAEGSVAEGSVAEGSVGGGGGNAGRIKCWQYHDSAAQIALIGDSAHATCPSLGQGCNAAITDATVLARLLLGEVKLSRLTGLGGRVAPERRAGVGAEEGRRDADRAMCAASPQHLRTHLAGMLARYSALQVPEGHALVDLSDAGAPISNLYSCLASDSLRLERCFPRPSQPSDVVSPAHNRKSVAACTHPRVCAACSGRTSARGPSATSPVFPRAVRLSSPNHIRAMASDKKGSTGWFGDMVSTISDFGKHTTDMASNLYTHMGKLGNPTLLTHAGAEALWREHFWAPPDEKLLFYFYCNLLTSVGPVPGTLVVTTASIGFLSDAEFEYNPLGRPTEIAKSHFVATIPLHKITGVAPEANPSDDNEKYIRLTTEDDFSFWFTGFIAYDQAFATVLSAVVSTSHPLEALS